MSTYFRAIYLATLAIPLSLYLVTTLANADDPDRADLIVEDQFQKLPLNDLKPPTRLTTEGPCSFLPTAKAGKDERVDVGAPVSLNGTGSTDQGCGATYFWEIIDRPQGSATRLFDTYSITPIFIADRAGVYEIELTVSLGGQIQKDTVSLGATGELESEQIVSSSGGAIGLPDGSSVLIPPPAHWVVLLRSLLRPHPHFKVILFLRQQFWSVKFMT